MREHETVFEAEYGDEPHARVVERSVRVEAGEIDGDRARATVEREGRLLRVRIRAADLVALRAGTNTWLSLVEVAERAAAAAGGKGEGKGEE